MTYAIQQQQCGGSAKAGRNQHHAYNAVQREPTAVLRYIRTSRQGIAAVR